jgi:hypothetical protein
MARKPVQPAKVTEYFYTMISAAIGPMTVSDTDIDLMTADREMALADSDKSEISEMMSREVDNPAVW